MTSSLKGSDHESVNPEPGVYWYKTFHDVSILRHCGFAFFANKEDKEPIFLFDIQSKPKGPYFRTLSPANTSYAYSRESRKVELSEKAIKGLQTHKYGKYALLSRLIGKGNECRKMSMEAARIMYECGALMEKDYDDSHSFFRTLQTGDWLMVGLFGVFGYILLTHSH